MMYIEVTTLLYTIDQLKFIVINKKEESISTQRVKALIVVCRSEYETVQDNMSLKTLSSGFANNKDPDQPAHPHSLISKALIICSLLAHWKESYRNFLQTKFHLSS